MSEFTKEQLRMMLSVDSLNVTSNLAKALLAHMERAEKAEATVADLLGSVGRIVAERDRLKGELEEASGAIIWLAAVKMVNAVPPDQVYAAITRAREREK